MREEREKRRSWVTIGVVGHPNVGKSTLINAIKGKKVCSTSISPGHTKHFQTVHLSETVRLCDSPGLVFPAAGMPKELQVLTGLFPISQTREPYSALKFLAERVPVEEMYGLLPPNFKMEGTFSTEDLREIRREHAWSAWDIAVAYANKRRYTTKNGRADTYRGGNEMLRSLLSGRIVFYFVPNFGGEEEREEEKEKEKEEKEEEEEKEEKEEKGKKEEKEEKEENEEKEEKEGEEEKDVEGEKGE